MTEQEHTVEKDAGLTRVWGVAVTVNHDGFVNPGSVASRPDEASAVRDAERYGGTAVTRLVTEWVRVTPPERIPPGGVGGGHDQTPA